MVRKFLYIIVDIVGDDSTQMVVHSDGSTTVNIPVLIFWMLLLTIVFFVYVNSQGKLGKKGEKKGSNNDSVCENCNKNKKASGNTAKKDSDSESKVLQCGSCTITIPPESAVFINERIIVLGHFEKNKSEKKKEKQKSNSDSDKNRDENTDGYDINYIILPPEFASTKKWLDKKS